MPKHSFLYYAHITFNNNHHNKHNSLQRKNMKIYNLFFSLVSFCASCSMCHLNFLCCSAVVSAAASLRFCFVCIFLIIPKFDYRNKPLFITFLIYSANKCHLMQKSIKFISFLKD